MQYPGRQEEHKDLKINEHGKEREIKSLIRSFIHIPFASSGA
jgi:hypothetical protein